MKHNKGTLQNLLYLLGGYYEEKKDTYDGLVKKGLNKETTFNKEWIKDLEQTKYVLDCIKTDIKLSDELEDEDE